MYFSYIAHVIYMCMCVWSLDIMVCVGHSSLACGTLICLFAVGNSFKTCVISVDLGKAFEHVSLFNRYILI